MGIAYFTPAGNSARQSYEAPFRPSGLFENFGFGLQEFHDFDPGVGVDTWQQFSLNAVGVDVSYSFQWGSPSSASAVPLVLHRI